MNFEILGLHPKIIKALVESGYSEPTKIQEKAIPVVLEGKDIKASAQTGTGKTAAFLLPALQCLTTPSAIQAKGPRVLVLSPTRELALQIKQQAEKYSKYLTKSRAVCLCGGVPYPVQRKQLSRPYDILIATPGRLLDSIERKKVDFSRLEMVILDEADRMLDMGFLEPVEEIIEKTPADRQTLLFTATLQGNVEKFSHGFLQDPVEIVVHAKKEKHENIEQKLHFVDNLNHKNRILESVLSDDAVESAIIFTSTKKHADQLREELFEKGYKAGALHGDMNQRQRTRTIDRFRGGKIQFLVATDVAARGIDVQNISHVINFDLPRNIEDYVHRIGRTGRAGAKGKACSLVGQRDAPLVKKIESFTGQPIAVEVIPGLEPSKSPKSPKRKRTSKNRRVFRERAPKKRGPNRSGRPSFAKRAKKQKV